MRRRFAPQSALCRAAHANCDVANSILSTECSDMFRMKRANGVCLVAESCEGVVPDVEKQVAGRRALMRWDVGGVGVDMAPVREQHRERGARRG
jgi:hypothetical protein